MSRKRVLFGGSAIGILCLVAVAVAQTAITQTLPADIKLNPIPFAPGAEAGFLAGDGNKPEMYTLRVHLAKDAKIPPHSHPDGRMVTILSGELFAGIGPTFDPGHGTLVLGQERRRCLSGNRHRSHRDQSDQTVAGEAA